MLPEAPPFLLSLSPSLVSVLFCISWSKKGKRLKGKLIKKLKFHLVMLENHKSSHGVGHLKGLGTLTNSKGYDCVALSCETKTNQSTVPLYWLHQSVSMRHEKWVVILALEHDWSSNKSRLIFHLTQKKNWSNFYLSLFCLLFCCFIFLPILFLLTFWSHEIFWCPWIISGIQFQSVTLACGRNKSVVNILNPCAPSMFLKQNPLSSYLSKWKNWCVSQKISWILGIYNSNYQCG